MTTRRFMQFSIRRLLTLFVLVALGVTAYLQQRELIPLRAEVRALRREAGRLSVDDPARVTAIGIETFNQWAWRWRVWIPPGKNWELKFVAHDIPRFDNVPEDERPFPTKDVSRLSLPGSGEFEVTARIDKTAKGEPVLAVECDGVTVYAVIPPEAAEWLTQGSAGRRNLGVFPRNQLTANSDRLLLIGRRIFYQRDTQPQGAVPPNPQPEFTDGLLLWLERIH
ncbi:MAG: hypothetical protein KDA61_22775 [Planctomycetales bacterium]|nr:hypothetical protein [Planctomycetales bacterium]